LARASGLTVTPRYEPNPAFRGDDQPGKYAGNPRIGRIGKALRECTPDEELAEQLSSEAMTRRAGVAKAMSDLTAKTAVDWPLIEVERIQIDRAQAENRALLREPTGKTL